MFFEIISIFIVILAIVGITLYMVKLFKSELSYYARTTDLNGYAKTSELSDYAKSSVLTDYAKTSALTDYAKTSDLSQYSKHSDTFCQEFQTNFTDGVTDPVNYLNDQIIGCPSGQTLNGMQIVKGGTDSKQFSVKYTCCGDKQMAVPVSVSSS